jgi:uncharacterized membrane protein YdjX (TVP38/TMEM64 family)
VKRINPIHLLIALNLLLILFRDLILPEGTSAALAEGVEATLVALGPFGYAGLVLAFLLCSFFFVPLMIPLNILGGALYGPGAGTAVALTGITLGCIASTISVRYVFTGMQQTIEKRPALKRLIAGADRHLDLVIVMVRFTVIVPYLFQNIALALTRASIARLTLLTAVSAIPSAAIYSFLGAGLVAADDLQQLLLYIGLPIALMLALAGALAWFRSRLGGPEA